MSNKSPIQAWHSCLFVLDFNKAFDSVDYWSLFSKLIDSNSTVDCYLATRVLAYWYSSQKLCPLATLLFILAYHFQWSSTRRHIISIFVPFLCSWVSTASITSLGYGCNAGGTFVNLLCCADDMVLLAPSWFAVYTFETAAQSINMTFNT